MEDYRTLIEVVSELVEKGYSIDFTPLENVLHEFQKAHSINIPPEDFLIDEIHCCDDDGDEAGLTYIFAISSKKHRFKGILINALSDEDSGMFPELFLKIKNAFTKVITSIVPGFMKNNIIKNEHLN